MNEPLEIECLTDETFPLGYERVTFRRTSPKYLAALCERGLDVAQKEWWSYAKGQLILRAALGGTDVG
jgi:hypothetical protein